MASAEDRIDTLAQKREDMVEDAVNSFEDSLKPIEKSTFKEITNLMGQLDIGKDGRIKNNMANVKFIKTVIRSKIEAIVKSEKYKKQVSHFVGNIDKLATNVNTQTRIQEKLNG